MNRYINHFFMRLSGYILFAGTFIFFPAVVQASIQDTDLRAGYAYNGTINSLPVKLLLAEAEQSADSADKEHTSGELVIPGERERSAEKKCMTVCKEWGEDCVINPRTGSRKCRRACMRFGEECF